MQLDDKDFKKQLSRFIHFRGIDIVLYLKNGDVVELDKNRTMEGDTILKNGQEGIGNMVTMDEILKADFFAA